MPRTYSSIEKIRTELAWVNEPPDPNKCGCRNLRCCEETALWILCSWEDSAFIVAEDLIRRAGAFRCGPFHKALEID